MAGLIQATCEYAPPVPVFSTGAGVVLAPDFCVPAGTGLVDVLPGCRLLVAEGEWVQALTLPQPVGSETARALVRFVRAELASGPVSREQIG